ncbi:hypothetical protein FHS19_004050 [Paenibacillus rhizosphaerae]|uniref:Uncharacterized protein n=1 Tax=Paenibacillus rhizosphaerae TaxID=297318 RepID=A0A839TRK5_9BACL|nr:hypothetical protein [Paenibacillus rhizosphaerae]
MRCFSKFYHISEGSRNYNFVSPLLIIYNPMQGRYLTPPENFVGNRPILSKAFFLEKMGPGKELANFDFTRRNLYNDSNGYNPFIKN